MKFYRPVAVASYRKLVGYQAGLLAGTCAMVAALILIGNTVTSDRIEAMKKADQLKMLGEVLPSQLHDNNLLDDQLELPAMAEPPAAEPSDKSAKSAMADQLTVFLAKSANKLTGMAFPVTANGYGGDIDMIMAVDVSGTILGVRVINHKETPGLGDKIEIAKDQWITAFDGLSLTNTEAKAWAVKKDGGQFDQFTGATITPRAIVRAVHQGLILINGQQHAINNAVKTQRQSELPGSEQTQSDGTQSGETQSRHSLALAADLQSGTTDLQALPGQNEDSGQRASHTKDLTSLQLTDPQGISPGLLDKTDNSANAGPFDNSVTEVAKSDE